MNLIKETEKYLCEVINNLGYQIDKVNLVPSGKPELGQFQINEAFSLAKNNHENPREVAEKIVAQKLEEDPATIIPLARSAVKTLREVNWIKIEISDKMRDAAAELETGHMLVNRTRKECGYRVTEYFGNMEKATKEGSCCSTNSRAFSSDFTSKNTFSPTSIRFFFVRPLLFLCFTSQKVRWEST